MHSKVVPIPSLQKNGVLCDDHPLSSLMKGHCVCNGFEVLTNPGLPPHPPSARAPLYWLLCYVFPLAVPLRSLCLFVGMAGRGQRWALPHHMDAVQGGFVFFHRERERSMCHGLPSFIHVGMHTLCQIALPPIGAWKIENSQWKGNTDMLRIPCSHAVQHAPLLPLSGGPVPAVRVFHRHTFCLQRFRCLVHLPDGYVAFPIRNCVWHLL